MNNILVIRNDKLGDFIQAWPAFAMLKASNPSLKLTALVPAYTAPLAEICPYLDSIIIDSKKDIVIFKNNISLLLTDKATRKIRKSLKNIAFTSH